MQCNVIKVSIHPVWYVSSLSGLYPVWETGCVCLFCEDRMWLWIALHTLIDYSYCYTAHSSLTQYITTHKQQSVTYVTSVINPVVSVSIHASLKLLYSLCFLTYMKMVNSTWFFGPGTTTFAHKVFILTTFVTQSFDLKMTYFRHRHSRRKSALFRCNLLSKT